MFPVEPNLLTSPQLLEIQRKMVLHIHRLERKPYSVCMCVCVKYKTCRNGPMVGGGSASLSLSSLAMAERRVVLPAPWRPRTKMATSSLSRGAAGPKQHLQQHRLMHCACRKRKGVELTRACGYWCGIDTYCVAEDSADGAE